MNLPSFQRIAPYYDGLAKLVFGNAIDNAQKAFFSLIPEGSSLLIIGGGSGKILPDLMNQIKPKHITYIEASSNMLSKAEKQYQYIKKTLLYPVDMCFIYGTEKDIPADAQYDVLMTFFLLDLYTNDEARELTSVLSAHLKASGSWLFADFCIRGSSSRQRWQRMLLKSMYLFFKFTSNLQNQSLPDYQRIFKELQYFPMQQKFFYKEFIASTIYRKLLS
ncbi:class I SAM-dependent methyltransferase [Catalinimonas niigatensis]|uniref:class I SAM-dependent methyltransferase n=1 Tax=Catalinimonas niigatensis TaxID=1397264 RepID=UPI002665F8BF|nr:methyltransferase domain-containing protein [Catalinimonas niigatensis]WPP52851.1 methyltransferase domain-containing protein [Catalinimonas niigatensis]